MLQNPAVRNDFPIGQSAASCLARQRISSDQLWSAHPTARRTFPFSLLLPSSLIASFLPPWSHPIYTPLHCTAPCSFLVTVTLVSHRASRTPAGSTSFATSLTPTDLPACIPRSNHTSDRRITIDGPHIANPLRRATLPPPRLAGLHHTPDSPPARTPTRDLIAT
jgi:hypothetical protein